MRAMTFPFRIAPTGSVGATQNSQKIWTDRVRAVVSTQLGDRVMRPDFGIDALSGVMNLHSPAQEDLTSTIQYAFSVFLPALSLESVKTHFDDATIYVQVTFITPDRSTMTTNVGFADGAVVSASDQLEARI